MIRLSQICCTSLIIELRNFNVNEIVNVPQRDFILILYILAFKILFFEDFSRTDHGINSEKLLLLIIFYNLFYCTYNLMANLPVINTLTLIHQIRSSQ